MQKYDNYVSQLNILKQADTQDLTNEFIKSGIIDKFSLQFELGWKLIKELLKYEGVDIAVTGSPCATIKAAYRFYPLINEKLWLLMLDERNNTAHIYEIAQSTTSIGATAPHGCG